MNTMLPKATSLRDWLRANLLYFRFNSFGARSTIARTAIIRGMHGISIGNDTHILEHAIIHCGPYGRRSLLSSNKYPDRLILGNRTAIQPFVFISTNGGQITIGDRCSINPFCTLYGYGGLTIGDDVMIASGTILVPQNHVIARGTGRLNNTGTTGKGIVVEKNVWIGAHVVVLDGVTIGSGSIIGAGSVVTRDVPPGVIVAGVPAEILRER